MIFKISTISHTSIAKQLVAQVEAAIQLGKLKAGDDLPSVRSLAKELHINPSTVSKAYKVLIENGVLVSKPGLGLFVDDISLVKNKNNRSNSLNDNLKNFIDEAIAEGYKVNEIQKTFQELIQKVKKD